jgi:peptidoglycan/LPS O-acetylase OafA/YrhL
MTDHLRPSVRMDSLDALRGICALSVALFHFETAGFFTNIRYFRHGWMLVDFFFVLSGFVITCAYSEHLRQGYSIKSFLLLRFARIWPLHVFMLLCFFALEMSKLVVQVGPATPLFAPPRELGSLFINLFFLQVFRIYNHLTWNALSWSIAAEFWVYIAAAIIFRFIKRGSSYLFAIITVAGAIWMILSGPPFLNLTYDGAVVRCLYGFSIGSLAWVAFAARLNREDPCGTRHFGSGLWTTLEVAVVAASGAAVTLSSSGPFTTFLPLLFGLCVLVLAHQRGQLTGLLRHKSLVWLGSISYSMYMIHVFLEGRVLDFLSLMGIVLGAAPVNRLVVDGVSHRILVGSELFINLTVAALLVLIITTAYACYRFIEQPCNRWARARIRRPAQPASMATPS